MSKSYGHPGNKKEEIVRRKEKERRNGNSTKSKEAKRQTKKKERMKVKRHKILEREDKRKYWSRKEDWTEKKEKS